MKTVQLHVPVVLFENLRNALIELHQESDDLSITDGVESLLVDIEDEMVDRSDCNLLEEDRYFTG